jgi:hypothetical protein
MGIIEGINRTGITSVRAVTEELNRWREVVGYDREPPSRGPSAG